MAVAITEAITTLAEAEPRFHLRRTEEEAFFWAWSSGLPALSAGEKAGLSDLRRR